MPCVDLPTGYMLLEISGNTVLAHNPNATFGRYVTWKVDRTKTGVHSGHYFNDIQLAVSNYVRRAELENKLMWDIGPDRANAL